MNKQHIARLGVRLQHSPLFHRLVHVQQSYYLTGALIAQWERSLRGRITSELEEVLVCSRDWLQSQITRPKPAADPARKFRGWMNRRRHS